MTGADSPGFGRKSDRLRARRRHTCGPCSIRDGMTPRPLDPDPFSDFNCLPLGFYLDPDAWQAEALQRRASVRHFRRLTITTRFAENFAAQLSRGTWGAEHERGWATLVAGKTRETRYKVETIQPLTSNDLLKAFVRLDRHGVGTRDRFDPAWLSVSAEAERPHISCIRFDIDLDQVFANEDTELLVEVVNLCGAVGENLQLPSSVMTTGRRGIQAHYTLPVRLTTAEAGLVRDALRLQLTAVLPAHANLDKDSVNHLLRLPLTRHAKTNRLALYLDPSGQVLPVEDQIESALRAWTPTGAEEREELLARIAPLNPPHQADVATQSMPALDTQPPATTIWRGSRAHAWSSLIREPLVAGRTWEYLVERKGVYAHVARYGPSEAKRRLRGKVMKMPEDGKMAERLSTVEKLVDTFQLRQSQPSEPEDVALSDGEQVRVEAYKEELRAAGVRTDCIARQEMVYAAWLVAERHHGHQVNGARIARTAERLYGAAAPKGRAVYRALDMLRERNKIWFVTLRADGVEQRLSGSFLVPDDLRE